MRDLPPARLYVVAARVPCEERVPVGSLGAVAFERGWYAYVGSARRGREARVARHMRAGKPLRWHADYLFARHPATRAWLVDAAGAGAECALAAALASEAVSGLAAARAVPSLRAGGTPSPASAVVPASKAATATPAAHVRPLGFGSSDCGCPGHLVHFSSLAALRAAVGRAVRALGGEARSV